MECDILIEKVPCFLCDKYLHEEISKFRSIFTDRKTLIVLFFIAVEIRFPWNASDLPPTHYYEIYSTFCEILRKIHYCEISGFLSNATYRLQADTSRCIPLQPTFCWRAMDLFGWLLTKKLSPVITTMVERQQFLKEACSVSSLQQTNTEHNTQNKPRLCYRRSIP